MEAVLRLRKTVEQQESDDASGFSWFNEDTKENLVDLVHALEAALEQGPDACTSVGTQSAILKEIRGTYRKIALGELYQLNLISEHLTLESNSFIWLKQLKASLGSSELPDSLLEEVGESCLDWAIASKHAENLTECFHAHLMRMSLCPWYQTTDSVRLLGSCNVYESLNHGRPVELQPIRKTGIFEIEITRNEYRPSKRAQGLGLSLREIFRHNGYTFRNCRSFLLPLVEDAENANHPERIFSANSFFNRRCELPSPDSKLSGLEALVRLFLFGVAVEETLVKSAIGKLELAALATHDLVTKSPACASHIVGQVQIYPISQRDLFGGNFDSDSETFLFMTDWPMESLLLTRDAVMAVGEDTLELMALSADGSNASGRLLDLCCGCGIQGIFAWCCAGSYSDLVCTDINERACYFAAANMALNNVGVGGQDRDVGKQVFVLRGDLYEGLRQESSLSGAHHGFRRILSNPPFVAIPPHALHGSPYTAPALYAIAGGVDGTSLLARIVAESIEFLASSSDSSLLMVTEVPNVETSCVLLKSFLPNDRASCVRIAYVGRDVESVQEYADARKLELHNDVSTRDWETPQEKAGIANRALVLIAITQSDEQSQLFRYGEKRNETQDSESDIEEEDLFLTKYGIQFVRTRLLNR